MRLLQRFGVMILMLIKPHQLRAFVPQNSLKRPLRLLSTVTDLNVKLRHLDYCKETADSKENTPVIFLHGLLGNKRNFASIGASLGSQLKIPRRLIGLDLRNHGMYCTS